MVSRMWKMFFMTIMDTTASGIPAIPISAYEV